MVLSRIGAVSAAKVSGILGMFLGLLVGAFMFAMFLCVPMRSSDTGWTYGRGAPEGILAGTAAAVAAPLLYGLWGALTGLVGAALYNLLAARIGGLEIELDGPCGGSDGSVAEAAKPAPGREEE
jgi:hypothetical protein